MAALDTAPLNSEVLGSGSLVNAYGGAIVFASATQTVSAVGTLTIPGVVHHTSIAQPMVVIGTLNAVTRVKQPGDILITAGVVGSVSPRVLVHFETDGSPVMTVTGTLDYWVKHLVPDSMTMTMAVDSFVSVFDLSTTPAPSDRISYVPANDRVSYVQRG